jgi:hypothetical protein
MTVLSCQYPDEHAIRERLVIDDDNIRSELTVISYSLISLTPDFCEIPPPCALRDLEPCHLISRS